jgi:oxygen-independent coproporphyrinogen-3 oxidase
MNPTTELLMTRGWNAPPWVWPRAAYVHVPFCAHHCGYCDFAVAAGQDHTIDLYLDALAAELSTLNQLGGPQPVRTLFLGGGTPTHLDARQLEHLLRDVIHWLPFTPDHEFTVEANPGTLDREKVRILADHGVNRVSLGAQSFHPHLLRILERNHDPADVPRAVEVLRESIEQVSLDLIFGVPGQTLAEWREDLRRALDLRPDHLSTYGLTYEKGTRLWKQQQLGEVKPLDEETELALYNHAIDALGEAGFDHYEISSFARPGRRCRHNQTYWANEAYFGFGMGAARYVQGCREVNTRDLRGYIKRALTGEPTTFQSETLPPEDKARETITLNLRRAEGIARHDFLQQTGFDLDGLAGAQIKRNVSLGLLADDGAHVRLTRNGKCVADALAREFL